MITSTSNNIRTNKIYFLKQNNPSSPNKEKQKMQLSAVHLSSIIQMKKKEEVNQEMMQLAKKLNQTNPFKPFLLSERPKSQQSFNVRKIQSLERNIYTSSGLKTKKPLDTFNFYLSDIIDQKWNGNSVRQPKQQVANRYQRSQSNKKNYKLRKYQFKIFLKEREVKPKIAKEKEIKQVVYEKQQINKWGQQTPLIHTSRVKRLDQRRKHQHLQSQLKVQGNSFQIKRQKLHRQSDN